MQVAGWAYHASMTVRGQRIALSEEPSEKIYLSDKQAVKYLKIVLEYSAFPLWTIRPELFISR